jgi:hypothetical protein
MSKFKLTADNYFSLEASKRYFSVSQYKSFLKCPARAMAEIRGEYKQPMTTALLVGSYVDSYFEGTLEKFKEEHPEIFKKDGTLKADYVQAEQIIKRIEADELFMEYMSGKKQVIKTGEIEGVPVKIKIDSYHPQRMIVDLKILRSCERIMGQSPISFWQYDLQGAIYQYIEGKNLPFFLAIATKEDVTDIEIVKVEQHDMDDALSDFKKNIHRFNAMKQGEAEVFGCGRCDYCKSVKKLTAPISSDDLGFTEQELRLARGKIF